MLAIRAARAFDGSQVIDGGVTLLLDDGKIVGLEPVSTTLPEGIEMVDHGDATILPGLIDSHVHLCGDSREGALDRLEVYDDDQLVGVIEAGLRRQLAAGVTTVRDLGDRSFAVVDQRDAAANGPRPTILAAGPPITSARGHCWNMGGEATGPEALRAAVAERVERGVDVVKIMASGGIMTPGTDVTVPQFNDEDLQLVVTEAHAAGLGVTAHAHALAAVEQAVRAGVDGIEHCTCMTPTGAGASEGLLEQLAARRIAVCPTLGIAPHVPVPPIVLETFTRLGLSPDDRFVHVAQLDAAGVLLVGGSDAGISIGKPHGILPQALVEIARCMPADRALATVTSVAARVCGLGDRKGALRPRYDADVLVVDGNPMADMAAVLRVRQVVVAGTVVDPVLMQT